MKICVICDESADSMEIGYLFYFEKNGTFSIELSDTVTEMDVPLFLASFIRKGIRTVPPNWSKRWVSSRIVPEERQNLGSILRENQLKEYDPYRLLMLGEGRCAQDDCMVRQISGRRIPEWVRMRRNRKLEMVSVISGYHVLLGFRDGTLWKTDLEGFIKNDPEFRVMQLKPERFQSIKMFPGGLGVYWSEEAFLSAEQLYGIGEKLPLNREEFLRVTGSMIMDTADVCRELGCSRQYIGILVKKHELPVLKESGNNRLYARNDVELVKE